MPFITRNRGTGIPIGVNSYEETLLALSPAHYWPTDEPYPEINFRDAVGALDLLTDGSENVFNRMPSPIRGRPVVPAIGFSPDQAQYLENTTGIETTGWTTGGVCGFVFPIADTANEENAFFSQVWNNNAGLQMSLYYLASAEKFVMEVSWNNNPRIICSTDLTYPPNKWYHVAAIQRADGNGIVIYINGDSVAVTNSLAGIATLDSWADDITTGIVTSTSLKLGDRTTGSRKMLALINVWRNNPPSASEILDLYNSASLAGAAVDYYEVMFDEIVDEDLRYWTQFASASGSRRAWDLGVYDPTATSIVNVNGAGVAGDDYNVIRPFPASHHGVYGTKDPWPSDTRIGGGSNQLRVDTSQAVGTMNGWISSVESISAVQRCFIQVNQSTIRHIRFGVEGDRPFFSLDDDGGREYKQIVKVAAAQQYRVEVGSGYMLSVVQDGVQLRLYINGTVIPLSEVDETKLILDETAWVSDVNISASAIAISGRSGGSTQENMSPNEMTEVWWSNRVISATVLDQLATAGFLADQGFESAVLQLDPEFWYRFDNFGSPIVNVGNVAPDGDLILGNAGGAFDGSYQQPGVGPELGESAVGGALKFGGQGKFEAIGVADRWGGQYGTIFWIMDPEFLENQTWLFGSGQGFDQQAVNIQGYLGASLKSLQVFKAQTNGDDSRFRWNGIELPNGMQTFAIRQNNDANGPDLFINGIKQADPTVISSPTPDNYWFGDFAATDMTLGARPGVDASTPRSKILMDEWLYFRDRALTDQEILDLHNSTGLGV